MERPLPLAKAPPRPPANAPSKRRYHHGDLREAAVRWGRELVATCGLEALTLRGLARELGVTAPALVYHFGSIAGLRSAVADSILEAAEREAFACAPESASAPPEEVGAAWVAFAEKNPLLYRLASGEGWRTQLREPNGWDSGGLVVRSPRRVLLQQFALRSRGLAPRSDYVAHADRLAFTIHGLALARLDGAGAELVTGVLSELRARPHPGGTSPR